MVFAARFGELWLADERPQLEGVILILAFQNVLGKLLAVEHVYPVHNRIAAPGFDDSFIVVSQLERHLRTHQPCPCDIPHYEAQFSGGGF